MYPYRIFMDVQPGPCVPLLVTAQHQRGSTGVIYKTMDTCECKCFSSFFPPGFVMLQVTLY